MSRLLMPAAAGVAAGLLLGAATAVFTGMPVVQQQAGLRENAALAVERSTGRDLIFC